MSKHAALVNWVQQKQYTAYLENIPENQHEHTSHQNQQDAEGKDICIEDVIRIASKTDERGEPGYNEATVQVNK
jgi:hypothetical protein